MIHPSLARLCCAAAVVVLVPACGGAAATPKVEAPRAVSADEAEREARSVVEESYGSLRHGNAEGLLPLLAEDLFVAGPRAADLGLARSDAVVALGDAVAGGKKHKVRSKDLRVVASPGGGSAWASDSVEIDGTVHALIAVVDEVDDLWVVSAVHVSRIVADKKLKKLVNDGKVPAPARPAPPAAPLDAVAKELEALVADATGDPERLLEQLASGDDLTMIANDKIHRGGKKVRKALKKRIKKGLAMSMQGPAITQVTPDGTLAWVCVNVDITLGKAAEVPYRVLYLYRRVDDSWELVAIHEAVMAALEK